MAYPRTDGVVTLRRFVVDDRPAILDGRDAEWARWLGPGAPDPAPTAVIEVDVRVTLTRDGGLADADVLRVRNPNSELAQYERRMRDLALNVIRHCTPIRCLPGELYDVPRGWRQFTYTFDPRQS